MTSVGLCRICHSGGPAPLIRPCACRGTMRYVHTHCAEEWVQRRLRAGTPASLAAACEICREPYAHVLYTPHPLSFLFSPRAWRRWAHIGYMLFIGRRIVNELRVALSVLTCAAPSGGVGVGKTQPKGRDVAGGVAFSVLMAAHYAVFFVVDARHLLHQFRVWKASSAHVYILDKAVGQAAEEEEADGAQGE